MAKRRATRQLAVWMNGEHVGHWVLEPDGTQAFEYAETWRAAPASRPLSLSMPLAGEKVHRGPIVESFFENLLPDSRQIRQRIQTRFHAASARAFDLLAEIGRDCVGAVQLLPDGAAPGRIDCIDGERLTEAGVAEVLRDVAVVGSGDDPADFRISLAGAQEKTALLWHKSHWQRPIGATPTTHIFKLPMGKIGPFQADFGSSCENEWLCARIVAALGLDVASCEIGRFGDQKALIVERFDRRLSSDQSHWLRLPQEDMCQAAGLPPSLKYESDGGPGVHDIANLLYGSIRPIADRETFFRAQVVFWMLCAPDGHAKNFSLQIAAGGAFGLAPLYDILSAYPVLGRRSGQLAPEKVKMAMAAIGSNRHYLWKRILPRHWVSTAHACGIGPDRAKAIVHELASRAEKALDEVMKEMPSDFPTHVSSAIVAGVRTSARQLRALE